MIAVLIPSRGMVHSRTMEHILRNLHGKQAKFFFTHDLPIPDCFNELVSRALAIGATHLWFVEEDMKLQEGTLSALLATDSDIATIDYPVAEFHPTIKYHGEDAIACGTGCVLIKAEVFTKLGKPYFRTDTIYNVGSYAETKVDPKAGYGKHDIDFGIRARNAGFKIAVVNKPGGQYRLVHLGKSATNQGTHEITEWKL